MTTSYDGYGRLTSYTRTGEPAQANVYNGLDDRVAVTSGSTTRRFVYDADGRVMGEYGSSATDVIAEFIWLSPEVGDGSVFGGDDGISGYAPLAVASGPPASSTLLWVHGNHLGVPQLYTNASGAPASPGAWQLPGFPGQSRTLADLYYNRYRDYDPSTGRYIQADPIGLDGDVNPYVYAGANPVTGIDPDGLRAATAGELVSFGARWWAKRQANPARATPWGRAWGLGEAIGVAARVGWIIYRNRELAAAGCPPEVAGPTVSEMAKTSRRSGKARSTDTPSWARGSNPDPGEGCKEFARRILDAKYGVGNWKVGANSEYSKIVKGCERGGR